MSGKTLDRLVGRTLGDNSIKKKRKSKKRPAKKVSEAPKSSKVKATKPLPEQAEISALKKEIAEKLNERVVWTKKARAERSWPGLTPGLAPVGYDPDESSDEEPY